MIVYGAGNAGDDNFDNRDRDLVRLPCRDHPRRHLARDERPCAAPCAYAIRSSLTFRCRKIDEQVAHQRKREGPSLDPLSSWQSFKRQAMPPMISSTRLVQVSTRTTSSPHTKYLTGQLRPRTGGKSLSTTVPGRATPTETETFLFDSLHRRSMFSEIGLHLGNLLGLEAGSCLACLRLQPCLRRSFHFALGFGLALSGDSVGPS